MSSLQYLSGDLFSYTNGAYEFCFGFRVVKFSSFGKGFDGLWNKEWQEPKLGDAQGTPSKYSRRLKSLSLGMPRKASHLSSNSIGMFSVEPKFLLLHMSCAILAMSFCFVLLAV